MKKFKISLTAVSLLALALASPALSSSCATPKAEQKDTTIVKEGLSSELTTLMYSSPEIPSSVEFCGKEVDLTRFDRHERMDRELLSFVYLHSTSLLMIKRANRYFPIIEPILRENNIPDDFKYLMVIESNVSPIARSGAGAAGLWQIMPGTAKDFGLEVNGSVDERYDIEKSTRAACRYLKTAYAKYNDWVAVAASYNAGQARIAGQLLKQDVEDSLDLHLVEETSRYVYRILAAKIMFSDPVAFGFRLRASDLYPPIDCTEITVTEGIDDLARFARSKGITLSILKNMNPWLRDTSLNNHGRKAYKLKIPTQEGMYYHPKNIVAHDQRWIIE